MRLTGTCFAGIVLLGSMLWGIRANADNEGWQDAGQQQGSAPSASLDWEQRALKRPQSGTPTAQHWVTPRIAQQPSYNQVSMETVPLPSEPGTPIEKQAAAEKTTVAQPDATKFEAIPQGSIFKDQPGSQHAGCSCGGGEAASEGECDCQPCEECCPDEGCNFGWEVFDGTCGPLVRGLSVFAGVDGFKGPLDRGGNGNFGVNEGLNLARPLGDPWGIGYQIGANFVQTDFSGAPVITVDNMDVDAAFRKQYFVTAGLFRRAMGCGFQWGVAYDFLHDLYYANANLQQVRSETSFVINDLYEVGYYGAYGVGNDINRLDDPNFPKLAPTDMFVLFVRRNFENGGDGRLWAGATGDGDGLFGADLWVPLGRGLALENSINYKLPKQGSGTTAEPNESWGLLIQLVWYPGQNAKMQQKNPYRPIFNVADNSLFMVDRLAR